jgi:acetyl-CoA acyltransferase 1
MERIERICGHLGAQQAQSRAQPNPTSSKSPEDIVIVSAVRTAIGRAKKGSFRNTHPGDLLVAVLKGVTERVNLDMGLIGDVVVGNVQEPSGFAMQARMHQLMAGYPLKVPITTCNRQCSSGLQAVAHIAAGIRSGFYEIGVAAGLESMSNAGNAMNLIGEVNSKAFESPIAASCLNTMGQTSENVAAEFKVSREKQDMMAVDSHRKALAAQAAGKFTEIVPVTTTVVDKKTGEEKTVTLTADEGPRAGTTMEKLSKLRAVFAEDGTTTAGNASQVSDGAAAALLMKRSKAQELGLPIKGVFRSFSVVGVRPEVMGIGPAEAIPLALAQAGITQDQVDVFEINEAFASQAVYCVETLGIDMKKVNPLGGAIALGHPLGCTGVRQVATLLPELERQNARYGVVSMCIGTGMGAAAVFERE